MSPGRAICAGLLMFGQAILSAQDNPAERLRLIFAEKLEGFTRDGHLAMKLTGRVQLVQGSAYLQCNEAIWYQNEDRALLSGSVVIYDGKRTLRADYADYDGNQKMEKASGNAVLENGRRKISARMLTYWQNEEKATAEGSVVVQDMLGKAVLQGGRMQYDRKRDYGIIEDMPVLVRTDTVSHKTWTVRGKAMQAWGGEQRALVTDSVMIQQEDTKGTCRKAEYFSNSNRIVLTGSPVVWKKTQQMVGDSMIFLLKETHFEGGVLIGHAEIVSSDSTGEDRLKGGTITIDTAGDTIRHIVVENQAESMYRVSDDKGIKQGVNAVTGDRIDLVFEGEVLKKVTVASRPGLCSGTYTPEKKAAAP